MTDNSRFEIVGYHGTTLGSAEKILQNGFTVTETEEDWVGSGIYFFVDGVSSGEGMAADWALFRNSVSDPCVVVSSISAPSEVVLDLRGVEGLAQFNRTRLEFAETFYDEIAARRDLSVKKRKDIRLDDAIVSRYVMNKLKKKILIHNIYIKNSILRGLELQSSYPTSTVCSVSDNLYIKNSRMIRYPQQ